MDPLDGPLGLFGEACDRPSIIHYYSRAVLLLLIRSRAGLGLNIIILQKGFATFTEVRTILGNHATTLQTCKRHAAVSTFPHGCRRTSLWRRLDHFFAIIILGVTIYLFTSHLGISLNVFPLAGTSFLVYRSFIVSLWSCASAAFGGR